MLAGMLVELVIRWWRHVHCRHAYVFARNADRREDAWSGSLWVCKRCGKQLQSAFRSEEVVG